MQLRIADAITSFAGSMPFIYIDAVIFGVWCGTGGFGHDPFPFGLLTMIVSLEAIFLSTFVMIGQNRQATVAEAKASHDFVEQEHRSCHRASWRRTNRAGVAAAARDRRRARDTDCYPAPAALSARRPISARNEAGAPASYVRPTSPRSDYGRPSHVYARAG
jgi:hypothetical protein